MTSTPAPVPLKNTGLLSSNVADPGHFSTDPDPTDFVLLKNVNLKLNIYLIKFPFFACTSNFKFNFNPETSQKIHKPLQFKKRNWLTSQLKKTKT